MRPIISGRNSLTSGCETYLLNLIQPLLKNCQYSISSTKEFKEKFGSIRDKFDPRQYEIVSYDAKSLFPSINLPRTVKHIIRQIYRDIPTFFPINDETPLPPPKFLLEKFFLDVLLKYNSFETLGGFYRQVQGVSMGGKLSGALSNIFLDIFEQNCIKENLKNKNIIFYARFVDDVCMIVKKGQAGSFLKNSTFSIKG